MSTSRYPSPPSRLMDDAAPSEPGPIASWVKFWFTPVDPVGLVALRVLGGLLFLLWLLPFAAEPEALFGLGGWFDEQAYRDTARVPELPPHLFSWSALYLCGTNPMVVRLVYWLAVAVIALFSVGLWSRVTGVLTWIIVVSFTANPATAYDADPLLRMLAFYLMIGHLFIGWGKSRQLLALPFLRSKSRSFERPLFAPSGSVTANLALRLFQVHFAIAMLANGLVKLQIKEWWNGLAFWFYLHPPYHETFEELKSVAPYADTYFWFYSLAGYAVLAWLIGFPAFAWSRLGRPILLGGGVLALLTIVFVLQLPLLGPIVLIGCLSYLTPAEWRRLGSLLARLPGVSSVLDRLSGTKEGSAVRGENVGDRASPLPVRNR